MVAASINYISLNERGGAYNDNSCDALDFGILVNPYGSRQSVAGSACAAMADFDGKGMVDILDFGLLVNSYGANGDP